MTLTAELSTMDEQQAVEVLADLRGPYRVPCAWIDAYDGDTRILVFTADPVLAVLVADQVARLDLNDSYPAVAGGGVAVDQVEVVLCGSPGVEPWCEHVDWRGYRPGDPYCVLACVVRPARPRVVAR